MKPSVYIRKVSVNRAAACMNICNNCKDVRYVPDTWTQGNSSQREGEIEKHEISYGPPMPCDCQCERFVWVAFVEPMSWCCSYVCIVTPGTGGTFILVVCSAVYEMDMVHKTLIDPSGSKLPLRLCLRYGKRSFLSTGQSRISLRTD